MADDRTTSEAKNIKLDSYQDGPLDRAASLKEAFAEAANSQPQAAQEQGQGSTMVEQDGNRHDMHPPADMRAGADRQAYDAKLAKERIATELIQEAKFDSEAENKSEYSSDYENDHER